MTAQSMDLLMFLSARFQLFQFRGPDFVVEILAEEIEAQSKNQNHNEEYDALREVEDIEHRIDPLARYVFDDVNPDEISGHEQGQTSQTGFTRWILPERGDHFQKDENNNIRVHHMIQPATQNEMK